MSAQISSQLFSDPRALLVTGFIIGLLGIIPGMPNLVFLTLASACFGGAWWISNHPEQADDTEQDRQDEEQPLEQKDLSWDDVKGVDVIGMEIGYKIIPLVDADQDGSILTRVKGVRRKLSESLGFLVQPVHIRDNLDLSPSLYRITIHGVAEGEGEIYPERELAINPGNTQASLQGMSTKDPAFGMDAVWIDPAQRDHAQMLGFTVVDASTVIATHLNKILLEHASDLLGHEETERLLEVVGKRSPKLIEDLVPKALPLSTVVRVLQNLLREGIPITDMRTIAETLAEESVNSQDADVLTAATRIALKRMIGQQINGLDKELPVITLDAEMEQILLQSLNNSHGGSLVIEPGLADRLNQSLQEIVQRQEMKNEPAVLLVTPPLRTWLARMLLPGIPGLKVLAYNEVAENKQLKLIASIGNTNAQQGIGHAA
ncbi:MAG TPA: flagellar biosynthesis protein FlhA, partial [Gammaproteobacteria bacterium]|nr:flagellar biosynthesis protein FlhA [Gammaproteobacteria bacterium]